MSKNCLFVGKYLIFSVFLILAFSLFVSCVEPPIETGEGFNFVGTWESQSISYNWDGKEYSGTISLSVSSNGIIFRTPHGTSAIHKYSGTAPYLTVFDPYLEANNPASSMPVAILIKSEDSFTTSGFSYFTALSPLGGEKELRFTRTGKQYQAWSESENFLQTSGEMLSNAIVGGWYDYSTASLYENAAVCYLNFTADGKVSMLLQQYGTVAYTGTYTLNDDMVLEISFPSFPLEGFRNVHNTISLSEDGKTITIGEGTDWSDYIYGVGGIYFEKTDRTYDSPEELDLKANPAWNAESDFKYEKTSGGYLITDFRGDLDATEVKIPGIIKGEPVVAIAGLAFYGFDDLVSVTIPYTISGTYENNIEGQSNTTNPFKSCVNLETIIFEDGIKEIPSGFLEQTNYSSLVLPDSVEIIRSESLGTLTCDSFEFPSAVKSIDMYAIAFQSVDEVVIPATVEDISFHAISLSNRVGSPISVKFGGTKQQWIDAGGEDALSYTTDMTVVVTCSDGVFEG